MTELVQDIDAYVDDVAAHLDGLPARARAELLEDLRAHVAEVLAEGGTLDDPAAYATELLQGATPGTPSVWRRIGRRWWIAAAVVVALLGLTGISSVSHTEQAPAPPAISAGG
jgi:hypothetical protein